MAKEDGDDNTKEPEKSVRQNDRSMEGPGAVAVKNCYLSGDVAKALTLYREARLAEKNQNASVSVDERIAQQHQTVSVTEIKVSDGCSAAVTNGKDALVALGDCTTLPQRKVSVTEIKISDDSAVKPRGCALRNGVTSERHHFDEPAMVEEGHSEGTPATTNSATALSSLEHEIAAIPDIFSPPHLPESNRLAVRYLQDQILAEQNYRATEYQEPASVQDRSYPYDNQEVPARQDTELDNDVEQNVTGYNVNQHTTPTARIVDHDMDEVWRRAQNDLIERAAIATVAEEEKLSTGALRSICGILLLVSLVVLAVTCGGGYCSRKITVGEQASIRANAIVELVNSMTLRKGEPIQYPFQADGNETPPPEVDALKYVIERDDLSAQVDGTRVIQRYVLALLWFSIGQYAELENVQANRLWLLGNNECQWQGVQCGDFGGTSAEVTSLDVEWVSDVVWVLPPDVGLLSRLSVLSMPSSRLSSSLPSVLFHLHELRHLDLHNNALSASVPSSLANLTKLTHLDLGNNKFYSTVPEEFSLLRNLEHLSLGGNDVGGTIPSFIAGLSKLTALSLRDTLFTGTVPLFLQSMTQLEELFIGSSTLDTPTPDLSFFSGLSNLKELSYLLLGGGSIPSEVAEWWPRLEMLSMEGSGITGTLPEEMMQWSNMRYMHLRLNELLGTIPPALFSAWTNLEDIDMGFNQLSGTIPTGIGVLTSVAEMTFPGNSLTGTIPTEIGLLTNLRIFHFQNNELTGTIPTESLQIPDVDFILEENGLNGTAPQCGMWGKGSIPLQNLRVDCDKVECECCFRCFDGFDR